MVNKDQRAGGTKPERRSLDPEKKKGRMAYDGFRGGGELGKKGNPVPILTEAESTCGELVGPGHTDLGGKQEKM